GGWAVTGPSEVTAQEGGSLSVSCSYKPEYKLKPKFWCQPAFFWKCYTYIAQTNGSEAAVTQGRVSIRDNHTALTFTVTMSGVRLGNEGWYSCGVKRILLHRLWHIKVLISPGTAIEMSRTRGSAN
ncbi:CLM3 protein, partial [Alectura lathami]|nr:CLM3 protein [Alectura lathami]